MFSDGHLGQVQKQQIKIDSSNVNRWEAVSNAVKLPINKITVNTDLKAALKQMATYKEGEEASYEGMKFKHENDGTITVDSDINFKKDGDEWVPTTLNAYVINVMDLERSIKIKYQQIVLGATSNIAMNLPMLLKRPKGSSSIGNMQAINLIRQRQDQYWSDPNNQKRAQEPRFVRFGPDQRLAAVTYRNETPYAIGVEVHTVFPTQAPAEGFCSLTVVIDEQVVSVTRQAFDKCTAQFSVLPNSSYQVNAEPSFGLTWWQESR